jgi:hypothetical protein
MGFHYGIECFQGCLYAHDRKQEYVKWQRHLRKKALTTDFRNDHRQSDSYVNSVA